MKYDPEALTRHVIDCAEQGMSQADVADLLRVSRSTIHRITSKLNIKLERKPREYGPNSDHYQSARADNEHHAGGAEDGDAAQSEAAFGGSASPIRRTKARDQREAAERLRAKLEGVTDKHERYEITYGHCVWEYEQSMYRAGKRDLLPSGPRRPLTTSPSMLVAAEKMKQHSIDQGNRLFSLIPYDRRVTASEAAELLGESVPRTSSYLKKMWENDKIYRVRDLVEVPGCTKRQWRWVFSKQPIQPLNNCFEDDK
jgi:DNA-binding MarR family transcriptional regulator